MRSVRRADSVQLQTEKAKYDQEIVPNQEMPSFLRLKTTVRRYFDRPIRTRNFKARNKRTVKGDQESKGESALRGKWELSVATRKESLAVSVIEKHRDTAVTDKRDNRPLLLQNRGHRLSAKAIESFWSQRSKSFLNERPKSVQKFPQRKVYESVPPVSKLQF